jgi:hypothetical protein
MTVLDNHRHDVHAGRARGERFGWVNIARVNGVPGLGFFRLGVVVDVRTEPSEADAGTDSPRLIELVGEVRVSGRSVGRFTPVQPGYLPVESPSPTT